METMLQPILIGVIVTIALSWAGWITLRTIDNSEKINKMQTIHSDIAELKEMVKQLNERFDTFIKQELDELKGIANKYSKH